MAKRRIKVVSAAIQRDGRYLITQRLEKAVLPLLWEFPGGRVEDNETDEQALARELEYRIGVVGRIGELLSTNEREYADYTVELHLYVCDIGATEPQVKNVQAMAWAASDEFDKFEFTPADQDSMNALLFEN